ncbi:hypothetical protein [Propionivibrio limicola]|uniref:hypothetical protein n=1 Tax=Propionivibrio limicola TaxID=167645 RepID=UPI001291069E|nr:hypothetical protein [Propionivibrio limicola]
MLIPVETKGCVDDVCELSFAPAVRQDVASEQVQVLVEALRDCRRRLHRGALESTKRISRLMGDVSRLESLNHVYRERIQRLESGVAMVEMGRRLMLLSEDNERLANTACQVWTLEKNLHDAHAECSRIAAERDQLAAELANLADRRAPLND